MIYILFTYNIYMCECNMTKTPTNTLLDLLNQMKKQSFPPEPPLTFSSKSPSHSQQIPSEFWFDDACILDMDYFVKTLAGIKAKGVRADLIGSIITHYASKWLPDLSATDIAEKGLTQFEESAESVTASWMKKRFFVETLVGVLPPEKDAIPCNFLLRLLRTGNMVGVEGSYREELEKRISWQLHEASLKELVIPSFSHTCGTLLDVELVIRLVNRFVSLDNEGAKSGAALVKVAKLVDCYLAEAAIDANFTLSQFITLVRALPSHARATHDGLYRAIDTYLKAHPNVTKEERKCVCRLIDSGKLTAEASIHAAQNERLPVRALIQVVLSEQRKLVNRHVEWSGSLMSPVLNSHSKREMNAQQQQQVEIRKLKEEVCRLQRLCEAMQTQMVERKKNKGFFKWRKFTFGKNSAVERMLGEEDEDDELVDGDDEMGRYSNTPAPHFKTRLVNVRGSGKNPPKWRKSMS